MPKTVALYYSDRNPYFAQRPNYDICVDGNTRRAIARNVKRLRESHNGSNGWTQRELAAKSGVAQRTISNIEQLDHPNKKDYSPTLDALERIAVVFGLTAWQLMLPLPDELLKSRRIQAVVECFIQVDEEGRANIARTAEAEVRYSRSNLGRPKAER